VSPRHDRQPAGIARTLGRVYDAGAALLLAGRAVQLVNSLLLSVLVLRLYGLEVLGAFALGFVPVALLAVVGTLGLHTYLPRARLTHAECSTAALSLHLAQAPLVGGALLLYAALLGNGPVEREVIFLVACGGYFMALSASGQMLSVMRARYLPGLVAPLCETAGLLLGAWLAGSPAGLAAALLAARAVGASSFWAGFRYAAVAPREILATGRRSVRYVAPDSMTLLGDQAAPLLLAAFATRADVGLLRLAQQLLNAADTPAWSLVQARYPAMVRMTGAEIRGQARQLRRLGWAAGALCLTGSWVFAHHLVRTPALFPLMTVLAAVLAWRYVTCHYDYALRAAGRVADALRLSTLKLTAALVTFGVAVPLAGAWGAVVGIALISVAAGLVYERAYHARHGEEAALALPAPATPATGG
jgi:O-antigen/teichoic acid export membrane protein